MSASTEKQAGFTLIELLIAVAIASVIAVLSYQAIHQGVLVKENADESVERFEAVQRTLWWMEQDFTQMAPRTVQDVLGSPLPTFQLSYDYGAEMTRIAVYPSPYGIAGLARIGYVLEDGVLYRQVWPVIDRAPDSEVERLPVLSDVARFEVRVLNADNQWQEIWPEADQPLTDLPRLIEVTLTLEDMGQIRRLFPGVDGLPGASE
ncbi:type II secretion system protein GspJ [Thiomicrospira sp. XS5]|uniref:type II secretion system minor pseudopilin GspJ n=1 Tax=Thiomicrospira sp. XS5 TaxID=1775636 RepID=UPI000749DFC0|nr:type II secretion system minor pseudopilin GspJ [Thiomicrospira sp. XS5]KUJ74553.1 type II secretion system protein GspJ [Thiomicrospira sp. XS5]